MVTPDTSNAGSALTFWADARVVRRSRAFAAFLIVNWVGMGYLVLVHGLRSLTGGLAFAFGILTLLAGMSQLRGVRLSRAVPLVRLSGEHVEFRPYSAAQPRSIALADVVGLEVGRDAIGLALRGADPARLPWLALSEPDRTRLEAALREKLSEKIAGEATSGGA